MPKDPVPQIAPPSYKRGERRVIPAQEKLVLIEGIYSFLTAREVTSRLQEHGIRKSERTVMLWLKETRAWLGMPGHYPCLASEEYRQLVRESIRRNGRPTLEDLAAGWEPHAADPR